MVSIYDFTDFRAYLKAWLAARPKRGRGESRRWAQKLGVSSTMISQVMSGGKPLSLELALELIEALGLSEREGDYFLLLVELDRAGSARLQARARKRIQAAQALAREISHRIQRDHELSPETKAIYYSSWHYTGIRNLTAVPGHQDAESIAERLRLSRVAVAQAIDFLLAHGLLVSNKTGLIPGPAWTHLDARSPIVASHHRNWRLRACERTSAPTADDLFFTSPMSLSVEASAQIRKQVLALIEAAQKIAGPSDSEVVRCLNLDWFEY